ncbi:MAG: PilZ domain-containing protein [Planctomycetota bacterium]
MSPGETDKRRDKRLDLTLPVKFFKCPDDGLLVRDGVTHNVSSGGVYFEAPVSHVVQDGPIALRIGVHARDGEDKPSLTLVGSGLVCRIEELEPRKVIGAWSDDQRKLGILGVAVQFHQRPTIQLRSLEELLWDDRRH